MAPSLRKRNHEGKVDKGKGEDGNSSQEDQVRIVTRSEEPEGAMRTSVQTSEQSPNILDSLSWTTTQQRSPLSVKKTSDNWTKAAASLLDAHDPDHVGNIDIVSKILPSGETNGTSAIVEATLEGMEELGGEPTVENSIKRKRTERG